MEIIARTHQAIVYQDVDGSVAKRYHTIDAAKRVLKDERSLGYLWKALGTDRDTAGWRYTVVRPLRADPSSGTIWLERAPGQPVFTLPASALLDAEYHVGIWLAAYHNRLLGEADEGLIFADTNVQNILVDVADKVVTGLDPGFHWGDVGNRYQDVIRHVWTLVVARLLRGRGSLEAVRLFLHGYASATAKRSMTARAYVTALGREARRLWTAYGLRSKPRQLAFAASSLLLVPLFVIYVPGVLARAMNSGRGRRGREAELRDEPAH
jgi:hypothetical protein